MAPAKFDRCVQSVKKTATPYKERTKEQSAYAICTARMKKKKSKKKYEHVRISDLKR